MNSKMQTAAELLFAQNVLFGTENGVRPNNVPVSASIMVESFVFKLHENDAKFAYMQMSKVIPDLRGRISMETVRRLKFLECEQNPLLDKFAVSTSNLHIAEFDNLLALLNLNHHLVAQELSLIVSVATIVCRVSDPTNMSRLHCDGIVFVLLEVAFKFLDNRKRSVSGNCLSRLNLFFEHCGKQALHIGSTAKEVMGLLLEVFASLTPSQAKGFLEV